MTGDIYDKAARRRAEQFSGDQPADPDEGRNTAWDDIKDGKTNEPDPGAAIAQTRPVKSTSGEKIDAAFKAAGFPGGLAEVAARLDKANTSYVPSRPMSPTQKQAEANQEAMEAALGYRGPGARAPSLGKILHRSTVPPISIASIARDMWERLFAWEQDLGAQIERLKSIQDRVCKARNEISEIDHPEIIG
jgi:hypothetical protein